MLQRQTTQSLGQQRLCVQHSGQESLFAQALRDSSRWPLHLDAHFQDHWQGEESTVNHTLARKVCITNVLLAAVNHAVRPNLRGKSNLIMC